MSPEFSQSLAVVVGINHYGRGVPELSTAVNDAKAIAQLLELEQGYDVRLLIDETATLAGLLKVLTEDLPREITAQDRVLFYFAGHGIATEDDEGLSGYLLPQDADRSNLDTYLSMQVLHDALAALPCRHLLNILDCCFSGAFRWSTLRDMTLAPSVIYQERYFRFIQDPAWQVITSSSYDQPALDLLSGERGHDQSGQHSPFAAALLEALRGKADKFGASQSGDRHNTHANHNHAGDGVITATELYLYLREHVSNAAHALNKRQTPGIWPLKKHDKGEYIFLVPGHPLNLPLAPYLSPENNPYRGLESFDEAHAPLFFGRSTLAEQLQSFVLARPLTVVLGASGTGKSSLVKAGLLPALRASSAQQWEILPTIRPGRSPLTALAEACLAIGSTGLQPQASAQQANKTAKEASVKKLRDTLGRSPFQLQSIISIWQKRHPRQKLLIVIDQFEELITACQDTEERKQFLTILQAALDKPSPSLHVVITLRSDFEPQFVIDALKLNWLQSRFIVPPMTQDDLRAVIVRPAQERVLYFEPATLIDDLINEVVQMPGALPLLSFTLSELYLKYIERCSDDRAFTQADYQSLGGVVGSITKRADQEYNRLTSQEACYDKHIRHVMLRMVASSGGESARRRVPLRELDYPQSDNEKVKAVVQNFVDARLLVIGQDAVGEAYVEPAHDALVRGWAKLQQWRNENLETLTLQQMLTPVADAWHREGGKQSGSLWNANPRLTVLSRILSTPDSWLNKVETQFIRRSLIRRRLSGSIRVSFSSVLAASFIFGSIIYSEWIRVNQIQANTRSATSLLERNEPLRALQSVVEATQHLETIDRTLIGRVHTGIQSLLHKSTWAGDKLETTTTLHTVLSQIRERTSLEEHGDRISSVAFGPVCEDGSQFIASASQDRRVLLRSRDGKTLKTLSHDDGVNSVDFSSDCRQLVTASGSSLQVWTTEGDLEFQWPVPGTLSDARMSPDGSRIATISIDEATGTGRLEFWQPDGTPLGESFEIEAHELSRLDFSQNGQWAAIGGNSSLYLWHQASQQLKVVGDAHSDLIGRVRISHGGDMLASAGNDGSIKLWNLKGDLIGEKNNAHSDDISPLSAGLDGPAIASTVNDLSFGADDATLVSAGSDQSVILWALKPALNDEDTALPLSSSIQLERLEVLKGHREEVSGVSFSPDGQELATVDRDATLKIWNFDITTQAAVVTYQEELSQRTIVDSVARRAILLQDDGSIRLWAPETLTRQKPQQLEFLTVSADEAFGEISISPNGQMLAVAREQIAAGMLGDTTIELWSVEGELIGTLEGAFRAYVMALKFSPDGQRLAIATDDNKIQIWSITGKLLHSTEGSVSSERTLEFSPNGKHLAFLSSSEEPEAIKLWQPSRSKSRTLAGHSRGVLSIRFSPDGKTIASGSIDQTARLWNLRGRTLRTFAGHSDRVQDVLFTPDSQLLASFGAITNEQSRFNGEIKLWNTQAIEIATLPLPELMGYLGMYFTADGNALVSAHQSFDDSALDNSGTSSAAVRWNLDRAQLLALGCEWLSDSIANSNRTEGEQSQKRLCELD